MRCPILNHSTLIVVEQNICTSVLMIYVSVSTILFMSNVGCCGVSMFRKNIIDNV